MNIKTLPSLFASAAIAFFTAASCSPAPAATDSLPEKSFPAPYAKMSDGLLGDITPEGWTREFLLRQVDGLTGHPGAMSYPYNSCLWNGEIRRNTDSYGSEWWRYEQTAYYTDGLLKTGYLLDNEDFIRTAEDGINYTLAHTGEGGRLGPHIDKTVAAMWPLCVYFRVLEAYYEKTGDERIVEALHRHYLTYTPEQVETWRAIVSIEGLLWTYGKTGDRRLLDLCETAWNAGKHIDLTPEACRSDKKLWMHGVTCCEELKLPVMLYAYTGKKEYLDLALSAQAKLERDDLLPDGVIASAEALVGSGNVINSHETCDIADYTWALGYFLMATGEGKWADMIEKAVFNACPGAITKEIDALQYFSSVNQVIATGESNHNDFFHGSTWMAYRPTHQTECCSGNVHRIMPNYVGRMWLRQGIDTVAAALYGPSKFAFTSSEGTECSIEEDTAYPFEGDIRFRFSLSGKARIPFSFRVPEWATAVSVSLNGRTLKGDWRRGAFSTIDRTFRDGDCLTISFGMEPRCIPFKDQGVYFQRGPLLYSYPVPEKKTVDNTVYENMNGKVPECPGFECWSFTPAGDWNWAWAGRSAGDIEVIVNEGVGESNSCGDNAEVCGERMRSYPFEKENAPVRLRIPARKIDWSLEEGRYTPRLPAQKDIKTISDTTEYITLIPYGCTELRVTVFPSLLIPAVGNGAKNLSMTQVDEMVNVLPETELGSFMDAEAISGELSGQAGPSKETTDLSGDTLRVARGENAVAQFVIDSPEDLLGLEASVKFNSRAGRALQKGARTGWVHYVRSEHHYRPGAPDSLQSATGLYPDPIITDKSENITAGGRAVLWVDVPVPAEVKAGEYSAVVSVSGRNFFGEKVSIERPLEIKVYPAAIGEQSLGVTNWFFSDKFSYMNGGAQPEYGSPEYRECFRSLVETASEYGQNTWIVYEAPQPTVGSDGEIDWDFSRFDAEVEFLLENANVRRIEGAHIANRAHNKWADPFWAAVATPDGKGGVTTDRLPSEDPRVREYLLKYFHALEEHLRSRTLPDGRTWFDIYLQHIADEPVDENRESWEALAGIAKEACPSLKIIEAYRAHTFKDGLIDVIVPQLDELEWSSYENVPCGSELWFYTCMYPRGSYANRYVTLPLLKTRILQWINFRYGASGFLHWGLNYWGQNGDPAVDASAPVNDWPGGDAYIVYPGYRKVYPSLRLAALREGIRDYELLRLAAREDTARTGEIARGMVRGYDSYESSITRFREFRRELLEIASRLFEGGSEGTHNSLSASAQSAEADGFGTVREKHRGYEILKQKGGKTLGYSPASGLKIIFSDGLAFKDLNRNGRLDPYEDWRLPDRERAADLAGKMSAKEIAGLMLYSQHQAVPTDSVGFWSSTYNGTTLNRSHLPHSALSDKQKNFLREDNLRAVLVVRVETPEIAAEWNNNLQAYTESLPLGIPVNISSDPRHETRAWAEFNAGAGGQISLWPISLGLAATFDPALVRRFGEIASEEYRAMGIATALSPQIDLGTEPRWCRFEGTFGEDARLTAALGKAYIDGFQTSTGEDEIADGWGYKSVNCMVKHWPGGGPEEGGRDAHYCYGKYCVYPGGNFQAHLYPFLEGAFKLDGKTGKAAAVMPYYTISYGIDPSGKNRGNGFSRYIVSDLLREKYGYDGVVCTDWAITHDYHKVEEAEGKCWGVETLSEARRHYEALIAGVDQFGGNNAAGPVMEAYGMWSKEFGEASARERFEKSAVRLLMNMFRTGLFENPYADPEVAGKLVGCPEFMKEGFEAQKKSVVMLKNAVPSAAETVENSLKADAGTAKATASKGKATLPLKGRSKVFIADTSESPRLDLGQIAKYYEIVSAPEEADWGLAVIGWPRGGEGYSVEDRTAGGNGYTPISLQWGEYTAAEARPESIAGGDPLEKSRNRSYRGKTVKASNSADAEAVALTKKALGEKPLVTVVYAVKPFVPAEIEPWSDALLVAFNVQYPAVLEVIRGAFEPEGMLPMQLPRDMATVERQSEDVGGDMECYRDSQGHLYDFAYGLNWRGVIHDSRWKQFHRE